MGTIMQEDPLDLFIDVVTRTVVHRPAPVKHPDLVIEYLATLLRQLISRNADERRGLYLERWRNLIALSDLFFSLNLGRTRDPYLMQEILEGEHAAMRDLGSIIVFDTAMRPIGQKRHILASEDSLHYAARLFRYLA